VDVQVEHVLPAGAPVVPAHVEAGGAERGDHLPLHRLHRGEERAHVRPGQLEQRRRVRARDHQRVRPRHRVGVEERQRAGRLVDDVRGDLPGRDAAEQAALHGRLPGRG
jgi:hypothetical protein